LFDLGVGGSLFSRDGFSGGSWLRRWFWWWFVCSGNGFGGAILLLAAILEGWLQPFVGSNSGVVLLWFKNVFSLSKPFP
jgi:hypothetical protein